jgi:hypothetical protein
MTKEDHRRFDELPGCGRRDAGRVVVDVPVSRCRTCGRDAEQILGPVEVLRAAATILELRARGGPVLDHAAALVPSRLASLQVIEALSGLPDRRVVVREELARAVEVAELDEDFEAPAAEGPDGRTRIIVFTQMRVLALLAVFTAGAADGSGPAFAVVYAALLAGRDVAVLHGWCRSAMRTRPADPHRRSAALTFS